MEITTFDIETAEGDKITWVKIDRGNGEATWMPKSEYDAQQEASGTLS